jgi:hypothetical protein
LLQSDVFALGVVMYEVLHTYTIAWAVAPDSRSTAAMMHRFAERAAKGYRPPIDPLLPPAMAALIQVGCTCRAQPRRHDHSAACSGCSKRSTALCLEQLPLGGRAGHQPLAPAACRFHPLPLLTARRAPCTPCGAQACWQPDPVLRPSMEVVVGKLANIDRSCVMRELDAALDSVAGPCCCTIS